MDELINKLLGSEVLTEETKEQVGAEFKALLEQEIVAARAEAEVAVRSELTEQYVAEREALVEAVDTKVEEFLAGELAELKEDIEKFRDLEAEMAERLVEARAALAEGVKGDMEQLIETLDTFLEERMTVEFNELSESIEEVKKLQFGRRLFEAFADEYNATHADTDGTAAALAEAKAELETTQASLVEAQTAITEAARERKMTQVLESLSGRPREVMEAILRNTPTAKLEEAYATYIPRVLHEGTTIVEKSEKESVTPVLAESVISTGEPTDVLLNGDLPEIKEVVTESANKLPTDVANRLARLAGLND